MLAIALLTAVSTAAAHPLPIRFDLRSIPQSQRDTAAYSRRWLPPRISELDDGDDDRSGSQFRFKGNKVKLKVPI